MFGGEVEGLVAISEFSLIVDACELCCGITTGTPGIQPGKSYVSHSCSGVTWAVQSSRRLLQGSNADGYFPSIKGSRHCFWLNRGEN